MILSLIKSKIRPMSLQGGSEGEGEGEGEEEREQRHRGIEERGESSEGVRGECCGSEDREDREEREEREDSSWRRVMSE